jgi:hypothetical protein
MANSNSTTVGAFVPTTNVWDVSRLYEVDVKSPEFKELLVRLYQNINNMALVLNIKDSGYYDLDEFVNGQLFFPNPALSSATQQNALFRQVFRKVINFGALPAAPGTKSVAHGIAINSAYSFTRIYATASDQVGLNYIPIPYASPVLANNIELNVDSTNVNITVGSNRSNFTTTFVILEYLNQ